MKELAPTTTTRYARCVNWDTSPVHPADAKSTTYWSVTQARDDNVVATFDVSGTLISIDKIRTK